MKTLPLALILSLFSTAAFAGTLTCELKDPRSGQTSRGSIDVTDEEAVTYSEGEVGDLSFNMDSPSCEGKKCEVSVTFNSSRVQDEVGQISVAFDSSKSNRNVLSEPIEDGRKKYSFVCGYAK